MKKRSIFPWKIGILPMFWVRPLFQKRADGKLVWHESYVYQLCECLGNIVGEEESRYKQ